MKRQTRLILSLVVLILLLSFKLLSGLFDLPGFPNEAAVDTLYRALLIASVSWFLIELLYVVKIRLLERYDILSEDNLESRKLHTQVNIIAQVISFLILLGGFGLILMSIQSIREIGIGIFASAGVVGIIIGLSAQKIVVALLAGIQIAFTQPFRLDDAVVVENEWGWIEEINLTFIVVRLWDKRRLVLPTTYFLEKPFQNWTRTTADIVGTVFIHTDYTISFKALRDELTRLLKDNPLWDGKTNVLQVTDAKERTVEVRMLVSAKNSPTTWDLRVHIREKMIEFIQKEYPQSLPRTRVFLAKDDPGAAGPVPPPAPAV